MSFPEESTSSEREFRLLAKTEHNVLARLLSADFPGKEALLQQLEEVQVRLIDAQGSFALEPDNHAPVAKVVRRVPVEAELEDSDGVTIHVLLHVINGLMSELEVYREDSGPTQRPLSPEI